MPPSPPIPTEARRLHPMTLVQRLLASLPALVLLLLPVFRQPDADAWLSLFMAGIYGTVVVPLLLLNYVRFRYAVTPREIVIQSGVFTRQHRSIPIERIQNIEIEQPFLPRLFGTAKVKIETAGSAKTEGELDLVGLEEAYRIREAVRAFQDRRPSPPPVAGPAPPEAPAPPPPVAPAAPEVLLSLPSREVVLSGVFRFSLLYIVLVFTAMEYTGLGPEEMAEAFTRGRLRDVADLATASPWLAGTLTVGMVLLFAWLTGLLVNVNRYHGFRLTLEGGKLHKQSGLLTRSEGTIPLRKVQALVLRTNPVMRAFGYHRLELQTMGLDAQQRGHEVAVPIGKLDALQAIAQRIRPVTLPGAFLRVSPRTIRRHFFRYTLRLLALVIPSALLWTPALWALATLPALLYLAVVQYRHHGYAFNGDYLFVRRGFFQPYLWVIPVDRFQVFHLSASFFQRRLGLRSINIDTAGAAAMRYPVIEDLPAEAAEAHLAAWYAAFQKTGRSPSVGRPLAEGAEAEEKHGRDGLA